MNVPNRSDKYYKSIAMNKTLISSLLALASLSGSTPRESRPVTLIPKGTPSEWMECGCVNWADEFPYKPDVRFRMWHDGDFFYIEFEVNEEITKAEQNSPGDFVHKDSAVECFLQPDPENSPYYYSMEWNAAGHLFLAWRKGREDPEVAPLEVIESVQAWPSLGSEPFGETALGHPWTLKVAIPPTALFRNDITSWDGFHGRMNVYKCAQGLPKEKQAFLSWQPVHTPKPSFHNPETFQDVQFEQ